MAYLSEINLAASSCLILIVFFGAVFYSLRIGFRGKAQYERVDRQGGSRVLSKQVMAAAYWNFRPMGRLLATAGISPNLISYTAVFFGLGAGVAFAFGQFGVGALASGIAGMSDALDGMVAHINRKTTVSGAVTDSVLDRYVDFLLLAGLAVFYRSQLLLLIVALLAIVGSFMVSYTTAKAEAIHVMPPRGSMKRTDRVSYLVLGAVLSPFSIQFLPWDSPRLGIPMIACLGLVALWANVSALQRFVAIVKAVKGEEMAQRNTPNKEPNESPSSTRPSPTHSSHPREDNF